MKPSVKQISPSKCFRIYEQARTKGSAYFTLPGSNKIIYSRTACLVDGYVYAEALLDTGYTAFRVDTVIGSPANPAFIPSNNHMSPF